MATSLVLPWVGEVGCVKRRVHVVVVAHRAAVVTDLGVNNHSHLEGCADVGVYFGKRCACSMFWSWDL